jgi:hypothetical protein
MYLIYCCLREVTIIFVVRGGVLSVAAGTKIISRPNKKVHKDKGVGCVTIYGR